METFTTIKDLVDNPCYDSQRQRHLSGLNMNIIDAPIIDVVSDLATLPYCFTLQSCFGHFLYRNQQDPSNLELLPISDSIEKVEYRIAYIALCIQNNDAGRILLNELKKVPSIDPDYIQFGCAEWFWERQVNSYALQVEPERYMYFDRTPLIDYEEALHIQKVREEFFSELRNLIHL